MGKTRIDLYDNAKGILITLTVVGHFVSQYWGKYDTLDVVYMFIYLFHMPAFCFMSGFFSKNAEKGRRTCVKGMLLPYIIIYTLWFLYYTFVWDKNTNYDLAVPGYAQWYLLSLFTWRLILPTVLRLKKPLIWSVGIALLVGFIPEIGGEFSLSRTIVFMPYFLLGYYCTPENIQKIKSVKKIWGILGTVLAGGIAWFYVYVGLPRGMTFAKNPYEVYDATFVESIAFRFTLYIVAIFMLLCLINLTPKKKSFLTKFGANSLMVLVIHVYVVRIFTFTGTFLDVSLIHAIAFIIAISAICLFAFSRDFITKGFDLAMDNIWKGLGKITKPFIVADESKK